MFFENFNERVDTWVKFRKTLENHSDPLHEVVHFWNQAPISHMSCDPFDKSTWLRPWDLINDNHYCEFSKILGIYYTLALTNRFRNSYFEIQIINDRNAQELKYILIVDDSVINYYYNIIIQYDDIPNDVTVQASYPMLNDDFTS